MCNCLTINIPGQTTCLRPGCKIKLGRFDNIIWILLHDWYSYGGNRPVCGWYMVSKDDPSMIKPLSKPDLDDIYLIEY